jgi:NAD(P) transhydrogenase
MCYDLLVIGNDPAGQQAALAAAKLHRKVLLIEQPQHGGAGEPLTLASDLLWDSLFDLPELLAETSRNCAPQGPAPISLGRLRQQFALLQDADRNAAREQFRRNGITVVRGSASLLNSHEVLIRRERQAALVCTASHLVIATGSQPTVPMGLVCDGRKVLTDSELLRQEQLPRAAYVVGGSRTGLRTALFLALVGVECTLIDGRAQLLKAEEIETARLLRQAHEAGVQFRLGQEVIASERANGGRVDLILESGVQLTGECAVIAAGRQGNTADLNLLAAGLRADERGRIWCNAQHQTWTPHIYAVGDVVGFPAVHQGATDAGRRAAQHAFGQHPLGAMRLALAN